MALKCPFFTLECLLRALPPPDVSYWLIATPVTIAFIAIMAIGAWIGLTMATTPPPKPIEEITAENETETT